MVFWDTGRSEGMCLTPQFETWTPKAQSELVNVRSTHQSIYYKLHSSLGALADEVIAPVFGETVAPITCSETYTLHGKPTRGP